MTELTDDEIEQMVEEELGPVDAEPPTAEEIEIAKAHCMCGARMEDHDNAWHGHSAVSQYDYYDIGQLAEKEG